MYRMEKRDADPERLYERRVFVSGEREREYTWRDEERLSRRFWYAQRVPRRRDDPWSQQGEEAFVSLMRTSNLTPQLHETMQQMIVALTQMRDDARKVDETTHLVCDGTLLPSTADRFTYQCTAKTPWEVHEQASVVILLNDTTQQRLEGRITGVYGTTLRLTTRTGIPQSLLRQFALIEEKAWFFRRQQEVLTSSFGEMEAQLGAKVFGYVPARYGQVQLQSRLGPFAPNAQQGKAIAHALGSEVTILFGPRGTGKSSVLTNVGGRVLMQRQSVLLTSHTNIATDNLFLKMVQTVEESGDEHLLRLLAEGRIVRSGTPHHPSLQKGGAYFHLTASAIAEQRLGQFAEERIQLEQQLQGVVQQLEDGKQHEEDMTEAQKEKARIEGHLDALDARVAKTKAEVLNQASLIAATCTEMYINPTLLKRVFDTVIIDEISMLQLIVALLVVVHAKKRVIVAGDPMQLAPIFKTACKGEERAEKMPEAVRWLGQDLLTYRGVTIDDAVKGNKGCILLTEVRRTHPVILAPLNHFVYRGMLTSHEHTLYAPPIAPLSECPLMLVDTSAAIGSQTSQPYPSQSRGNRYHVQVVVALIPQILATLPKLSSSADPHAPRIGVLVPYRTQARLILQALKKAGLAQYVHVGTVHTVQALEFEVVILDTVEAPGMQPSPFIFDRILDERGMATPATRLLNVGHGRAKHKLIYIAHRNHLNSCQPKNPEGKLEKQRLLVELVNWAHNEGHISSARVIHPSLIGGE